MSSKSQRAILEKYRRHAFMNLSLTSMEGEEWMDMPEFDGHYAISNYGRIWAAPRPIFSTSGQLYFTRERMRKQNLTRYYNSYVKDYTDQLSVHLRYEGKNYGFKVNRLVYHFFVKPLDTSNERLPVIHRDGDNCNNHYDNLVLMTGTQLYKHILDLQRIPRSGRRSTKGKRTTWSPENSPRPIIKYSLEGKKLKTYTSVAEAAADNQTHRGNIRAVASGKLIQSHGFVYRFQGDHYRGEHADFSYEKPVTQYALNGKRLNVFPSVKQAGVVSGIDSNTISKCALGKARIAGGYVWRYGDNPYKGEFDGQIRNSAKTIQQYSLEGKVVGRFSSVNEAAKETGFSTATLLDCAYKRSKVSHGFVWRFAGDTYRGEFKDYRAGRPVTQMSLEGKVLKTYHTIEAAAKASGLTSDNIQKNVTGANRTAGGFIWRYAKDSEVRKLPAYKPGTYTKSSHGEKEVIQYSIEGKKLAVYSSITEASRAIGLSGSGIAVALDSDHRSSGGFVWRTKGNPYRGLLIKNPPANKAKTVSQYDLKGRRVAIYPSTKQAEAATGVYATTISQVALGKLKSTGGFIWQYGKGPKTLDVEAHYASTREHVRQISKAVAKYTIGGKFICEYPSIHAAAREEGISAGSISSVINGQSQSAGGNLWKLLE
ncbi:NUMOD1 domain-containing protein [Chryseolinea serpens]|uniref:NUMOD1 domain-containing protein n=2 Tax=Chryseolinea serpens TaxID=947013 RepID=A0A1M5QW19_9BACT|nr:NUMOD1 domain-containing protein [Chryseolinea serpens]